MMAHALCPPPFTPSPNGARKCPYKGDCGWTSLNPLVILVHSKRHKKLLASCGPNVQLAQQNFLKEKGPKPQNLKIFYIPDIKVCILGPLYTRSQGRFEAKSLFPIG